MLVRREDAERLWAVLASVSLIGLPLPGDPVGRATTANAQEAGDETEAPGLPAEDQDLPRDETSPAPAPAGKPAAGAKPPIGPRPAAAPAPTSAPTSTPTSGPTPFVGGNPQTPGGKAPGTAGGTAKVTVPAATGDHRGAASVPSGQELVNIDFPEPTEIKDIIKAVALWTGKNVILDRNVNGKVQIISPRKVTKEEAYQAFLSALNLLGLTTVETGKVIKIMPVRTAVKGNLKTFLGSSWTLMTDEIITQIVPLKYIDAKEIQSTLSRIVSSNSMIAYPPTNTLIISDSGYKVRRVLDILELLDVQGQQSQVAIVPIKYAEAKSIADKVSEIFKSSADAKKGAGGSYRSYKIMTDERTNSVIIFGPPRTIADVKALVRKFDIQLEDPSRQSAIHVRPLDYADSKKLAATLAALATGKKTDQRRPPILPPLGVPGAPGQPATGEPTVASLGDDVKIAADESSNSLLITGSHAAYQTLNTLIRKLDLRRSQVFVEADILDINMDGDFKFENHVFAGKGAAGGTSIATTWQAGALGPLIVAQASQIPGQVNTPNQANVQAAAQTFSDNMNIGILSGKTVNIAGLGQFSPGALITLIKTDSNTRILSTPNILTSNNEEAQIVVGEKLFFTSKEITPQTGAIANKVEKEDVDLTLTIKPNISHSNYVTLNTSLEQASVESIDAASGLPRLNKRKSKQVVTVKNSQTVVISGLMQTREFQGFQKIPLLGDIPIIGWLFRNSDIQHARTNLMIFLTPHIIHGADDLAAVYQEKVKERDEFLASIFGANHIKDDFYALLPTKEDGQYVPDEVDRQEKARQDEMMREMYQEGAGEPTKKDEDEKKGNKVDETPSYVPLSPGDEGGGGSEPAPAGEGAPAAEPPPPPPPPEPPQD